MLYKMKCPYCLETNSKVTDKRNSPKGIRRRRECKKCKKRFTTYERVEPVEIQVEKRDGEVEEFNKEKLETGVRKAFEKRPVSEEKINKLIKDIEKKIKNRKNKSIKSQTIGKMLINKLKKVDEIAYIRFISVYKDFQNVKDFNKEIKDL